MTSEPNPLALPLNLDTDLYLYRAYELGPTPTRKEVVDALVARFDAAEQRERIRAIGVEHAALQDMYWLVAGGSLELLSAAFRVMRTQIRRPSEAPQSVRGILLVRAFVAHGWVGERERRALPLAAFDLVQ